MMLTGLNKFCEMMHFMLRVETPRGHCTEAERLTEAASSLETR